MNETLTIAHRCPQWRGVGTSACVRTTPQTFTEAEARAVGVTGRGWPYGPNICGWSRNRLVGWAADSGYCLADPRQLCLHWLTGETRRCGALRDTSHEGRIDHGWFHSELFDHVTCWTRSGKPALILAQPYQVSASAVARVIGGWPVNISVTDEGPWYGHGARGVLVTLRG